MRNYSLEIAETPIIPDLAAFSHPAMEPTSS